MPEAGQDRQALRMAVAIGAIAPAGANLPGAGRQRPEKGSTRGGSPSIRKRRGWESQGGGAAVL